MIGYFPAQCRRTFCERTNKPWPSHPNPRNPGRQHSRPVAVLGLMMLLVPALGVPSELMLQDKA